MPLDVVHDALRPLDVGEYHRMLEAGILSADERIELLEGRIVAMPPCAPPHAHAIQVLTARLVRAAGDDLVVRVQLPLTLGSRSEPEPDLAVVRVADLQPGCHPGAALLVVEVSDSSARIDRGPKAAIYAGANVPEYWIVDVARGRVEVLTDPDATVGEYRTRHTFDREHVLTTSALPALALPAGDLFET